LRDDLDDNWSSRRGTDRVINRMGEHRGEVVPLRTHRRRHLRPDLPRPGDGPDPRSTAEQ
jgi:hypothetical protein